MVHCRNPRLILTIDLILSLWFYSLKNTQRSYVLSSAAEKLEETLALRSIETLILSLTSIMVAKWSWNSVGRLEAVDVQLVWPYVHCYESLDPSQLLTWILWPEAIVLPPQISDRGAISKHGKRQQSWTTLMSMENGNWTPQKSVGGEAQDFQTRVISSIEIMRHSVVEHERLGLDNEVPFLRNQLLRTLDVCSFFVRMAICLSPVQG